MGLPEAYFGQLGDVQILQRLPSQPPGEGLCYTPLVGVEVCYHPNAVPKDSFISLIPILMVF
jgi:hypothetical protein